MIQLANDPNASRTGWRAASEKGAAHEPRRRSGPAWPFLSPHARRPAPQEAAKPNRNDSGS